MSFDLKTVLSGMSREEALACVVTDNANFPDKRWDLLKVQGKSYSCPPTDRCPDDAHCGRCWNAAINAFYDDLAKPKWVEPEATFDSLIRGVGKCEVYYPREGRWVDDVRAEIARTNARRKVEAFIRQNGGGGNCTIRFDEESGVEVVAYDECLTVGSITCATEALAEEVIRRYPDELRLLSGKENE